METNLLIDIGNTNITMSIHDGDDWGDVVRVKTKNKTCVHLSIPPAKGVFGRVMYDIPISVPDYASAFAFDLKVSDPEAFRDGAFYLMDKQFNCLVDGTKPANEEQFTVCVFRNMSVEGKRISPQQATDMRISFRITANGTNTHQATSVGT